MYSHLFYRMELNGFNTVMIIVGLQQPENEHNICFLVLQRQKSTFMPTIQGGCFIIRTMNKTNSHHEQN